MPRNRNPTRSDWCTACTEGTMVETSSACGSHEFGAAAARCCPVPRFLLNEFLQRWRRTPAPRGQSSSRRSVVSRQKFRADWRPILPSAMPCRRRPELRHAMLGSGPSMTSSTPTLHQLQQRPGGVLWQALRGFDRRPGALAHPPPRRRDRPASCQRTGSAPAHRRSPPAHRPPRSKATWSVKFSTYGPGGDRAAKPGRLQRVLPAAGRDQAAADECHLTEPVPQPQVRRACRRSTPPRPAAPRPADGSVRPSASASSAPRSGWRGAMMVSKPGVPRAQRIMHLLDQRFLARMSARRQEHRPAGQAPLQLPQHRGIRRQIGRGEFQIAHHLDPVRRPAHAAAWRPLRRGRGCGRTRSARHGRPRESGTIWRGSGRTCGH